MMITPRQLLRRTWLPHPVPAGEQVELISPWPAMGHLLTCVSIDEEIFVMARNREDQIRHCWKVLKD